MKEKPKLNRNKAIAKFTILFVLIVLIEILFLIGGVKYINIYRADLYLFH